MDQISWKSCNLVIVNYQEQCGRHPLYLGISTDHARLLDHAGEDTFVCCLQTTSAGGPNGPRQLIRQQYVAVEVLSTTQLHNIPGALQPGLSVILYASDVFIRHYDLSTTFNVGFSLRKVNQPTELSHVTLSACTEESFAWLSGREWYDQLLLDACGGRTVLCRQDDVCIYATVSGADPASYLPSLRHLFDARVVECRPTKQGIVGPRTAFTVIRFDTSNGGRQIILTDCPVLHDNPWCYARIATFPKLLALVAILLLPRHLQRQSVVLRLLVLAFRLSSSWKESYSVQVLPKPPLVSRGELALRLDPFQLVFVTSAFLERHNLPDLCWMTAELMPLKSVEVGARNRRRWVRTCAVDRHPNQVDFGSFGDVLDRVAYVTPQLWFNLNSRPSKLIEPSARLVIRKFSVGPNTCKPGVTSERKGLLLSPAFASQVHVSLVNTVESAGSVPDCYSMLSTYFAVPRVLCKGDIFTINSAEDESITFYFLVTDMHCALESADHSLGLLVDKMHSTLYQEGATQSYVPLTMNVYHSTARLHPIWNSPMPCGFTKHCDQLTRFVLPYLKSTQLRLSTSPTLCLTGAHGSGKMLLVRALSKLLNVQVYTGNCHEVMGESSGANENRIKAMCQKAATFAPCLFVLRNVHVVGQDSDGVSGESRSVSSLRTSLNEIVRLCGEHPVFLIGITTEKSLLSTELASLFLHHYNIEPPNNNLRFSILSTLLDDASCSLQVSLERLVKKSSGFVLGDLTALVSLAVSAAYRRVHGIRSSRFSPLSLIADEVDLCLAGVQILDADFDESLSMLQSAQSDAIGAPKIPDVTWQDVGGLEYVKSEILDTVQLPLEHPELLASGLRRSGVLLYGPPGTGKTLLAKAVASECSLNFLSIKGPELINMYVGQSEENVRKVFQRARSAAPCIIFFDELDSLAPNRGRSGDSGGVMDRVVSQLLAELDGLHRSTDVFVMGATNRPDLIDPALLRPGRFDKLLCVGVCHDSHSQLKILEALTRKFKLSEDFSLSEFVERCPKNLSGADFYALCSDALLIAMSRRIQQLEAGIDLTVDKNDDLVVSREDFDEALTNLTPSLSSQELNHYNDLQNKITH